MVEPQIRRRKLKGYTVRKCTKVTRPLWPFLRVSRFDWLEARLAPATISLVEGRIEALAAHVSDYFDTVSGLPNRALSATATIAPLPDLPGSGGNVQATFQATFGPTGSISGSARMQVSSVHGAKIQVGGFAYTFPQETGLTLRIDADSPNEANGDPVELTLSGWAIASGTGDIFTTVQSLKSHVRLLTPGGTFDLRNGESKTQKIVAQIGDILFLPVITNGGPNGAFADSLINISVQGPTSGGVTQPRATFDGTVAFSLEYEVTPMPELSVEIAWSPGGDRENGDEGGIDIRPSIIGLPTNTPVFVDVYWANGDRIANISGDRLAHLLVFADDNGEVFNVPAEQLGMPPSSATGLLVVIDPPLSEAVDDYGSVEEFDENNNGGYLDRRTIVSPVTTIHGETVEVINFEPVINPQEIRANFQPAGGALSIAQASVLFDVDHFNWYQTFDLPAGWSAYEGYVTTSQIVQKSIPTEPGKFSLEPENWNDIATTITPVRNIDPARSVGSRIKFYKLEYSTITKHFTAIINHFQEAGESIETAVPDDYEFYFDEIRQLDGTLKPKATKQKYFEPGKLIFRDKPSIGIASRDLWEVIYGIGQYTKFKTELVGVSENGSMKSLGGENIAFEWWSNGAQVSDVTRFQADGLDGNGEELGGVIAVGFHDQPLNYVPSIGPITAQSGRAAESLSVDVSAGDPDLTQTLTYSLDSPTPGALIDRVTGKLDWNISPDQAPGDYELTIRVTDDGSPALSSTTTFSVHVLPPAIRGRGEFQVNTFTTDAQHQPSVAATATGEFVVAWANDTDGGIYARRFDANGVAAGTEIQITGPTDGIASSPTIAMDTNGDFVVVWQEELPDGDVTVSARAFDSTGSAQTSAFQVHSDAAGDQQSPSVAIDAEGNFVVVWQDRDGSEAQINGRGFRLDGTPLTSEFQVSAAGVGGNHDPVVAMDPSGEFVVVWNSYQDVFGDTVYARRYASNGSARGDATQASGGAVGRAGLSTVAMNDDGDFVVVWTGQVDSSDETVIFARQFDASSDRYGGIFRVNQRSIGSVVHPAVTIDAGGNFIIAWEQPEGAGIQAQRYRKAGQALGAEVQLTAFSTLEIARASIAFSSAGDFVLAWQSAMRDGSGWGVFAQRYQTPAIVNQVRVADEIGEISEGRRLVKPIPAGPSLEVHFSRPMSQEGGAAGAGSVTNPLNWILMSSEGDFSDQITNISYNGTTAILHLNVQLDDGNYQLRSTALPDSLGDPLDGDFDGASGGDFVRSFSIQKSINTTTFGNQFAPAIGSDADGNYVVAWVAATVDGSDSDVYARRFTYSGIPIGPEFLVNADAGGTQSLPAVAMNANGDFVITWKSQSDTQEPRVYAKRYRSDGIAVGSEFQVNTHTVYFQTNPRAAINSEGSFVIAWNSYGEEDGSSNVVARRYTANGTTNEGEFHVNNVLAGEQSLSSIAMNPDGNLVVTWVSNGIDGETTGVFARQYDALGGTTGSEFRVNSAATGLQLAPSIAIDASGDFVVAWTTYLPGIGTDNYARRYDAHGVPKGAEFLVSPADGVFSFAPSATMDAAGNFKISWARWSPGSREVSLFIRSFDRLGASNTVEAELTSFAFNPEEAFFTPATTLSSRNFVISWSSFQDVTGYDVFARSYLAPTSIEIGDVTESEDAAFTVFRLSDFFAVADHGDSLVYTVTAVSNPALFGNVQIGNDLLSMEYAGDKNGTSSITIRATDSVGQFVEETFSIVVAPINDAPSFSLASTSPISPDGAGVQLIPSFAIDIAPGPATATDELIQSVVFIVNATGVVGGLTFSNGPSISPTGVLAYTVSPGTSGTASFGVELRDNGSAASPHRNFSDTRSFTIHVVPPPASVSKRFDFNLLGSSTQDGYFGVTPAETYSLAKGYGWNSAVGGLDRGAIAGTTTSDLIRDAHFFSRNGTTNNGAKTFSLDLPNGTYWVNLVMGDKIIGHDQMQVNAEGGTAELTGVANTLGAFAQRGFSITVSDGQLNLEFSDLGGIEGSWVVNALDVRTMTGSQGSISITGPGSIDANGTTVSTYSGTGASPNALLTINTSLGTVVGSDASTLYGDIQVQASASGNFSFTLQAPTSAGTAVVSASQTDGQRFGLYSQTYGLAPARRLDFNGPSGFATPGFLPVRGGNLYNPANPDPRGFGWASTVGEADRTATVYAALPLRRDGHFGLIATPNTFYIDVKPNTSYGVRVYVGDVAVSRDLIQVAVEGAAAYTITSLAAGAFDTRSVTGISTDNGSLAITLTDLGRGLNNNDGWIVSGIDIWEIGSTDPGASSLLQAQEVGVGGQAAGISKDQLAPIVAEAIARWGTTGLTPAQVAVLQSTQFEVLDLGNSSELGNARPGLVQIDDDAAGHGWYIDSTPADDAEFATEIAATEKQATSGSAVGRIDLLTLVMHELGHELGLEDVSVASEPHHLMAENIAPGVRRLPAAGAASPLILPVPPAVARESAAITLGSSQTSATAATSASVVLPGASTSPLTVHRSSRSSKPRTTNDFLEAVWGKW